MKAWYSARELAGLPGMPGTERGIHKRAKRANWPSRPRKARGGGREYAFEALPPETQAAILAREGERVEPPGDAPAPEPRPAFSYDPETLWAWAKTRPEKQREKGRWRADLLRQVTRLMAGGRTFREAAEVVGQANGVSPANLRNWYYGVNGRPGARDYAPGDWPAALIPGHVGRVTVARFDAAAWEWCKSYYLTRNGPSAREAARRTIETAREQGWTVPSIRTIERRLQREISEFTRVYHRQGPEALRRLLPWQRRDKLALTVGEIVSGDGLKFDKVWVDWGDEILNTTTAWIWQDVYSGRLLAHRVAKTENTDLFRLATYDLVGILVPRVAQIDNTTVAANKAMTGRAPGRHRFHSRPEDPMGILLQLDIHPQFTNPDQTMSNPGVKPIERAFRDLHEAVRQNPKLLNRGYSKATAVPIDEFRAVVAEEIARHNARKGRRTPVCGGVKSFDEVFFEAYGQAAIRKATDAQRQLLLLMPEVVRASKGKGEIQLSAGRGPNGKPRYWHEALVEHQGARVVAYYDPENLSQPVQVYSLDGRHICAAERIGDTGFNDTQAAREWAKYNRRKMKALKKIAEDEARMSALEVAALAPEPPDELEIPAPGVVVGNFRQKRKVVDGRPVEPLPDPEMEELEENLRASIADLALARRRESLDWS